MAAFVLPFEKPIATLLDRVRDLRAAAKGDAHVATELRRLEEKAGKLAREIFEDLSAIQRVQLARHPQRPYTLDYVERLFTDWIELHGDRRYGDDAAIVTGLARHHGRSVVVVGHQKGRGAKDNVVRNFGMPHPEGYRKAMRAYELADRFDLPILTFVDTPGAYPGIAAEERGQSEAIGAAIAALTRVRVPVVATIIGEGGSGGALALAVGNRVLACEFAWYSVITPEGCAAILWKDGARAPDAAEKLRITARDLLRLGVVDAVVAEPPGGAHQDLDSAAASVDAAIREALASLDPLGPDARREDRYRKFRAAGAFVA